MLGAEAAVFQHAYKAEYSRPDCLPDSFSGKNVAIRVGRCHPVDKLVFALAPSTVPLGEFNSYKIHRCDNGVISVYWYKTHECTGKTPMLYSYEDSNVQPCANIVSLPSPPYASVLLSCSKVTGAPTTYPTPMPTHMPTNAPTEGPSVPPTQHPVSQAPTASPVATSCQARPHDSKKECAKLQKHCSAEGIQLKWGGMDARSIERNNTMQDVNAMATADTNVLVHATRILNANGKHLKVKVNAIRKVEFSGVRFCNARPSYLISLLPFARKFHFFEP